MDSATWRMKVRSARAVRLRRRADGDEDGTALLADRRAKIGGEAQPFLLHIFANVSVASRPDSKIGISPAAQARRPWLSSLSTPVTSMPKSARQAPVTRADVATANHTDFHGREFSADRDRVGADRTGWIERIRGSAKLRINVPTDSSEVRVRRDPKAVELSARRVGLVVVLGTRRRIVAGLALMGTLGGVAQKATGLGDVGVSDRDVARLVGKILDQRPARQARPPSHWMRSARRVVSAPPRLKISKPGARS